MPQPTKGARLGGSPAHQRLILANLATSLFQHGKITTTAAKAKRLRPYAERLITKAKRGDLHNRREIQKLIRDRETVHRLMHEIGPFFADRNGGYTRITKTLSRQGDNAPMAVIELVSQKTVTDEADRARRVAGSQRRRPAATAGSGGDRCPPRTTPRRRRPTAADDTSSADSATGSATEVTADRNAVDEAEGSAAEPAERAGRRIAATRRTASTPGFGGGPHGLRGGLFGARGARTRVLTRLHDMREPAVPPDGGLVAVPAPFPEAPVPERRRTARFRLDIAYDGTDFSGWAVQPGRRTVAGVLTDALAVVLREPVALTVAGRTDAGVHATGQVASADLPAEVDPARLVRRLARLLPSDVRITAVRPVPAEFDARFAALRRHYRYRDRHRAVGCRPAAGPRHAGLAASAGPRRRRRRVRRPAR